MQPIQTRRREPPAARRRLTAHREPPTGLGPRRSVRRKDRVRWPRLGVLLALGTLASAGPALADTYTYDALGRLKTVTRAHGAVITYTYDAAGNRTSIQTASGVVGRPLVVLPLPGLPVIPVNPSP